MHFRSRTQRDCMDLLVYLVDSKSPLSGRHSLIARLLMDLSQEIAGLCYGTGYPVAGSLHRTEPRYCFRTRSFRWDPEVPLGPGGVAGTQRCRWDPEVPLGPGGVDGTHRCRWDPEAAPDSEKHEVATTASRSLCELYLRGIVMKCLSRKVQLNRLRRCKGHRFGLATTFIKRSSGRTCIKIGGQIDQLPQRTKLISRERSQGRRSELPKVQKSEQRCFSTETFTGSKSVNH
ncbi:hypothetical protein Bca4012_058581 [Brassica carinata]